MSEAQSGGIPGIDMEGADKPAWQVELDKLPNGAAVLLHIALDRVDEIKRALEEGRFTDAAHHLEELRGKVTPLAHAEATLGSFAERTSVVRAKKIRVGMHVYGWGDVVAVDSKHCEHQAGESHEHVLITIDGEDEPREVADIQELMVKTDDLTGAPDAG